MTTGFPVSVTSSQMLDVGMSLLLNQKQSPAGIVPLPALNVCGTVCVVGAVP